MSDIMITLQPETFCASFVVVGYLSCTDGEHLLAEKGEVAAGDNTFSKKFGPYHIWP